MRRNHFEMQTLVYWYESAVLSCLCAWATTLSWSESAAKTAMTGRQMARYLMPIGMAGVAYAALVKKDYYKESLDKHLAWLVFHGALGASMANAVHFCFAAGDPRRYVLQDVFVLLGYNFGYALFPYIIKD